MAIKNLENILKKHKNKLLGCTLGTALFFSSGCETAQQGAWFSALAGANAGLANTPQQAAAWGALSQGAQTSAIIQGQREAAQQIGNSSGYQQANHVYKQNTSNSLDSISDSELDNLGDIESMAARSNTDSIDIGNRKIYPVRKLDGNYPYEFQFPLDNESQRILKRKFLRAGVNLPPKEKKEQSIKNNRVTEDLPFLPKELFNRLGIKLENDKYNIPEDKSMQILIRAYYWEESTPVQRQNLIAKGFFGKDFGSYLEKNESTRLTAKYGEYNPEIGLYVLIGGRNYEDKNNDNHIEITEIRDICPDLRFKINETAHIVFSSDNLIPYLILKAYNNKGEEFSNEEMSNINSFSFKIEFQSKKDLENTRLSFYWKNKPEDKERLICERKIEFYEPTK